MNKKIITGTIIVAGIAILGGALFPYGGFLFQTISRPLFYSSFLSYGMLLPDRFHSD